MLPDDMSMLSPAEMQDYKDKFSDFIQMCHVAEKNVTITVASRWVIGDTEKEQAESIRRLKQAGLSLLIVDENALVSP